MVDDRTADGVRIAQLLASELTAGGGALSPLAVSDADPDVDPTTDGALAYRVERPADGTGSTNGTGGTDGDGGGRAGEPDGGGADGRADDGRTVAEVYVHPTRVRVEFVAAPDAAARAGEEAGLRVRPKAVRPPRTVVFVEDGAEVKRVVPVVAAAVEGESEG